MKHHVNRRLALAMLSTFTATGGLLSVAGCAMPSTAPAPTPLTPSQDAAARLFGGVWTSDQRSRGGLGETLAFHRGGDVTHAMASIIDARYTVAGDTLRLTTRAVPDEPASALEYLLAFEGDTLVLRLRAPDAAAGTAAPPMALRRAAEFAAPAPRSLVGAWDYAHPLGRPGRMRFTSDGRALLLVNLQSHNGHFEVAEGRLALHLQGQPVSSFGLRFEDSHMLLSTGADNAPAKSYSHFVVS